MTGESDVAWTVGAGPTARCRGEAIPCFEENFHVDFLAGSARTCACGCSNAGRSIAVTWIGPR